MDTEALAVAAVKGAIARTDYLTDYIKDKEKEPLWDGSIYAYSSPKKRNVDWRGKAPVQIKGKNVHSIDIKEIKYDLSVSDLKNYKKDGGLLFFVVGINGEGTTRIFYKALTPYIINDILVEKGGQKTVRISFFEFPTENNNVCNIILDFIRDSKEQELFTREEIPALEDFLATAGKDLSYRIGCSRVGYDKNDSHKCLLGRELYMYARNTKLDISFPIEYIPQIDKVGHSVEGNIIINDQILYDRYEVVHKLDSLEIHIGQSVVIEVSEVKPITTFKYKIKGNIKERIQDIQFIVELLEYKKAKINGVEFVLNVTEKELEEFNPEGKKKLRQRLVMVDNMLSELGVKKALDIDLVSDKEEEYMRILFQSFVEGKTVRFKESKVPPVGVITIGNVCLALHFQVQEDGSYLIKNYMDMKGTATGWSQDGNTFPTSRHIILKAEQLAKVDNLDYSAIIDDILLFKGEEHFFSANMLLLEILKAYDITQMETMLSEATRLAEWLCDAEKLKGISKINYLQCIARRGQLSDEQENELMDMLKEYADNDQMLAGIYILLGNYKLAKKYIDKLEDNTKAQFVEFPIYALMK